VNSENVRRAEAADFSARREITRAAIKFGMLPVTASCRKFFGYLHSSTSSRRYEIFTNSTLTRSLMLVHQQKSLGGVRG
jgi:hypothetical protein